MLVQAQGGKVCAGLNHKLNFYYLDADFVVATGCFIAIRADLRMRLQFVRLAYADGC